MNRSSPVYLEAKASENIDNVSATEQEFRESQRTGKEILIYIKGNDETKRDKRLRKLISEIRDEDTGYKYKRFNNSSELKNSIYESLIDFLREKGIVGKAAFDSDICEDAGFSDIDVDKIRRFLLTSKNQRNFPLSIDAPVKRVIFKQVKVLF